MFVVLEWVLKYKMKMSLAIFILSQAEWKINKYLFRLILSQAERKINKYLSYLILSQAEWQIPKEVSLYIWFPPALYSYHPLLFSYLLQSKTEQVT